MGVDINTAPVAELRELPVLGAELALEIARRRPFKSWEAFQQAFGFDHDLVRLWQKQGATIGSAHPEPVPAPPPETVSAPGPPDIPGRLKESSPSRR